MTDIHDPEMQLRQKVAELERQIAVLVEVTEPKAEIYLAQWKAADEENVRLRAVIEEAPHQMGCASLQGGPDTEGWATLDKCNCWKRKALEGE